MKNINLIDDDIYKLFWKIAVPSSIGTIFQNLYSLVDSIFAGRMISEIALAAIGQTFPIYFVIIALGIGLSIASWERLFKESKLPGSNFSLCM